ncbi:MAG: hypothetical protein EZS28_054614, partial [Streblomastix strix]
MDSLLSNRILEDSFRILEAVGKGTFGIVYKALDLQANEVRALKEIKIEDEQAAKEILNEIQILERCKHPNIVRYYETLIKNVDTLM